MAIPEDTIGIEEAARRLGTTPLNVLMHLRADKFKGSLEDDVWEVDVASLERFMEEGGGAPDKKLCKSGCAGKSASCACG